MDIPDNKYLGVLCKRGHDFMETGKSLRMRSNRCCIKCMYHNKKIWQNNNPVNTKAMFDRGNRKRTYAITDGYVKAQINTSDQYAGLIISPNNIIMVRNNIIKDRKRREIKSVCRDGEMPKYTYLGQFCVHKHQWGHSGKSLRGYYTKECVICLGLKSEFYKQKRREKKNAVGRKNSAKYLKNLTDSYVKTQIINCANIQRKEISPELIIAKRELIKLKREAWRM